LRRRQVWAKLSEPEVAIVDAQIVAETPKDTCPKCGKVVKKSLHLHTRSCKA